MALSLVCDDCGAQLKSIQECQAHQDATGHLAYSESTAAVKQIVCKECGKPCRSETEQDLHTKRTGHNEFVDKTGEAEAINTEAEMLVERAALRQETPDLRSEASLAIMDVDDPQVPASVDVELRQQLEDLGFTANKATRALYFSGTNSIEQAVEWIMEHEDDADLDEPLLVSRDKPKAPKLDPEEAKRQAADMLRKAKEKREKEERELERLREQERVRAGKELLLAKRQEDDLRLKRNLEERKREKEEEARARDRIRQKLAEDRAERRRKLGLPELTPEELAAEAAKEAAEKAAKAKAKAKPAPGPVPVKPISVAERVRAELVAMKKGAANEAALNTCWATLSKYCGNVARDPGNEKFRRINTANAAFQSRVASQTGATKVLELAGFATDASSQTMELPADKVSIEVLNTVGAELHNAQNNPFFGVL